MPRALSAKTLDTITGQLIFEQALNDQHLRVFENKTYRWFTLGGDVIQAIMSLQQPEKALLPVPRAMLMFLLWQPQAKNILNLGLGAAGIERVLENCGITNMTSIESEQTIISMAKKYFNLPPSVLTKHAKAADYIAAKNERYDVILCDIFANEVMPNCLNQAEFYRNLSRRVIEQGSVLINIIAADNAHLIRLITVIKRYFSHVALIDFIDYRNILLIVRNAPLPEVSKLERINCANKDSRLPSFSQFISRIRYIPN
jgi:spermidine synthase